MYTRVRPSERASTRGRERKLEIARANSRSAIPRGTASSNGIRVPAWPVASRAISIRCAPIVALGERFSVLMLVADASGCALVASACA